MIQLRIYIVLCLACSVFLNCEKDDGNGGEKSKDDEKDDEKDSKDDTKDDEKSKSKDGDDGESKSKTKARVRRRRRAAEGKMNPNYLETTDEKHDESQQSALFLYRIPNQIGQE